MSLSNIAESGDRLDILKALRQKLADTLDKSKSGRDIASLSRQLQAVLAEIEILEAQLPKDPDEMILEELINKHSKDRVRTAQHN